MSDPVSVAIIAAIVAIGQAYLSYRVHALATMAAVAEKQRMSAMAVAEATHELARKTEINTNSRYTEQLAEIKALKLGIAQMAELKAAEIASLKTQVAKLLAGGFAPTPADGPH